MRDLRFALIGAGAMGKAYSIALANYPMYIWPIETYPIRDLIVEVDPWLADTARRRFGFQRSSTDWRAAVEDPTIDVVCVLLPTALHHEVAMAALAAGKHVICEKPLAATLPDARELATAAAAAEGIHQVGFNWRLTPGVQMAGKLIAEGALGEIRMIKTHWLGDFYLDPTVPMSWKAEQSELGGGALGDIGSHAIDFARFLGGEIDTVLGMQDTYARRRPSSSGDLEVDVRVDDATSFMARFASGATGYVEVSWAAAGKKTSAGFEVTGSLGSLAFDWERMGELAFYDSRDATDRQGFRRILVGPEQPFGEHFWGIAGYQLGYADTKVIQLADFLAAVVNPDQRPQTTFVDGLRASLVEEAVIRSARTGAWTAASD